MGAIAAVIVLVAVFVVILPLYFKKTATGKSVLPVIVVGIIVGVLLFLVLYVFSLGEAGPGEVFCSTIPLTVLLMLCAVLFVLTGPLLLLPAYHPASQFTCRLEFIITGITSSTRNYPKKTHFTTARGQVKGIP